LFEPAGDSGWRPGAVAPVKLPARSVNLLAADGSRLNFYDGRGHLDLTVDGHRRRHRVVPAAGPTGRRGPAGHRHTNGAGDALAVGFLVAHVLQGHSVAEAVRRGQLGARWTCAQRASSGDLITPARLAALIGPAAGPGRVGSSDEAPSAEV
jgi:hypothetical protein